VEVQIVIDGQPYELPAGTDPEELRRRVAQAVFRCEVEQLHLADGRTMLVNWRSVRLVEIRAGVGADQGHEIRGERATPTSNPSAGIRPADPRTQSPPPYHS
jgi:hypothetical protein